MPDLRQQLEEAEAHADRLRRQIAAADCRTAGCKMEFYGGRNAGCGDGCNCSVPVHVCPKCGDSDYGDNDEARRIREDCARRHEERSDGR